MGGVVSTVNPVLIRAYEAMSTGYVSHMFMSEVYSLVDRAFHPSNVLTRPMLYSRINRIIYRASISGTRLIRLTATIRFPEQGMRIGLAYISFNRKLPISVPIAGHIA